MKTIKKCPKFSVFVKNVLERDEKLFSRVFRRNKISLKITMVRAKASAKSSMAGSSKAKEAKAADQVEVYRKEMCAKAQALLETTIPKKLEFLCELLQGEKWQPEYR